MSQGPPSLRFAGGAGTVTGSKYVLCTGNRASLKPPRASHSLSAHVLASEVEVASDGGTVPLA